MNTTSLKNRISSLPALSKQFLTKNKSVLFRLISGIVVFGIIFLNSGYTYTYLIQDTFYQTLVLVISFLVIGLLFLLAKDFSSTWFAQKKKFPPWTLIAFATFGVGAFLTIFVNHETASLMMYMSYGLRIICAILIADLLNFEKFVKYYQISIFILTLFAIFIFLYTLISGANFSIFNTFNSGKETVFFNYYYLSFQYVEKRMQGIFWEPGMLASFLLLALSFELIFRKKVRPLFVIVFLLGLILTFSTFGYLCFAFVIILFVNKKVRKFWVAALLYFIVFGSLMAIIAFPNQVIAPLVKWLPDVFGKLAKNGTISFFVDDRSRCISFDIQCWLQNPIFGNGMSKMTSIYEDAALSYGIHAQTSTLTYYLAEFGILGLTFPAFFIAGLFSYKKLEIENKVILLFLYLVILFKEPHQAILFDYVLLFLLVKEGLDKNSKSLIFDEISENSIIKSLAKKDNDSIMKRNILFSFSIKGLALVLGFFSYPIYMRYFDNESALGVWLTILSIMSMIITFDLGLGNGLRNKLVKPLLDKDVEKQNKLITSTYLSTMFLSLIIFVVFAVLIFTIDINKLLGISSEIVSTKTLRISILIVFASICLEFFLKNITVILQALQKQAFANSFALLSTICLMVFASIVHFESNDARLLGISIFYAVIINVPLIVGTIIVLKKYFPDYVLRKADFSKDAIKEITTLAIGFFIIQMMLLVINSTNELLISNFYGSNITVIYTDYNKLIQIVISLFATITLPYWSMVAKMKEQGNISGIYKLIKKLLVFIGIFSLILLLMFVFFQPLLDIWLGEKSIVIDRKTLVFFMIFAFVWIVSISFSSIANGLSIIKQQVFLYGAAAVVKIVGSVLFGTVFKNIFGWEYIVLSNVIACSILAVGLPIICFVELRKSKGQKAC